MPTLKKQIDDRREAFDRLEPLEGHQDRFLDKLRQQNREQAPAPDHKPGKGHIDPVEKLRWLQSPFMQLAAAAVLVLLAIFVSSRFLGTGEDAFDFLGKELLAVEQYYTDQAALYYDEITSFEFTSKEDLQDLEQTMQGMESGHLELLEALRIRPGDESARAALIRHHQVRLGVLEQVLEQFKQVETVINENDENS